MFSHYLAKKWFQCCFDDCRIQISFFYYHQESIPEIIILVLFVNGGDTFGELLHVKNKEQTGPDEGTLHAYQYFTLDTLLFFGISVQIDSGLKSDADNAVLICQEHESCY